MLRRIGLGLALIAVAGCAAPTRDLAEPVAPLGNFRLGHSEVVAPNLQKLLISRDATAEEWIAEVDRAIETRFGRFTGDKYYHLGISVEAYSLPPPVIPGKSALALRVTVWDDAAQSKLNTESHVIQIIRVFESRISETRESQMKFLAEDAARQIEDWMREQQAAQGWFGGTSGAAPDAAAVPAEPVAEAPTEG